MTKMLGSDAIVRSLELSGAEICFGIPGGAILPTYDAFYRAYKNGSSLRHVLTRHEQGAGHMAEGYARASGRPGVAIATSGPGATNLVTPIADAWMDSTPLVCITGQVASGLIGTDAFQETDATGITLPIVKHSWLVQDANEIAHAIKAAFHVASTGRCGPVLVDITRDAQGAEVDFAWPDQVDLPGWNPPSKVNGRQIAEAAKAILAAQQPIFYVGGGVVNGEATAELRELVELTGIPVVTTLMGKGGFPDSHPLAFGHPGMHGGKWANWALNKSDLIIAVGTRFDDRVTGKVATFAPDAKVIHFDVDAAEISKIRHAEIPLVGPLKLALAELTKRIGATRGDWAGPQAWLRQVEEWRERFPFRYDKGDILKPQTIVELVRDMAASRSRPTIYTTGVGQHQMWAMQYLVCDDPRTFITSGGLGTMGYGVPAAIGAKAARPDADVINIDGDGCFQMTCQELATAYHEKLPTLNVVVNNGFLGMVRQWQEMFYDERYAETHLTHSVPDYAALAAAYGCAGFMVNNDDELEETFVRAFEALDRGQPVVVDARCSSEEKCFPMIPPGASALDQVEYGEAEIEEGAEL
jgi:acetolactate synthase-1/2/3 large subunit